MIAFFEIYGGHILLIDAADYDLIKGTSWSVQYQYKDGAKLLDFPSCVRGWVNGKTTSIHAVLMNPPKGMKVDHINGDILDNRRENLRICTNAENIRNSRRYSNNKTGIKGVSVTKSGKFRTQIRIDGKQTELGLFDSAEAAGEAYREAALTYYGEFARIA